MKLVFVYYRKYPANYFIRLSREWGHKPLAMSPFLFKADESNRSLVAGLISMLTTKEEV